MNTPRRFNVDQELADWLEDGPSTAPDETLDGVLATFPALPQRRTPLAGSGNGRGLGIVRGLLQVAAVVAVAAGAIVLLPRLVPDGAGSNGIIGASPSSTATSSAQATVAAAVPTPTPTAPVASPQASAAVVPTQASPATCAATDLASELLDWQGAAGTRFGTVRVRNMGTADCLVSGTPGLQLIDGQGAVYLDSATLGGPASVSPTKPVYTLRAGATDSLYLLVGLQNVCMADPVAPVHLALVMPSNHGRVVGTEANGVSISMAPCNGPGQPSVLHVQQGWSTTAP